MKKTIILILALVMALTTCACSNVPAVNKEVNVDIDTNVDTNEAKEVSKEHEHNFVAVSNNDGTHTFKCDCGVSDITENCIYDENYICSVCGYEHKHNYECVSNDDGTHTYRCKCGNEFSEDCNMVNNGVNEVCDVCGYTHDIYTFEDLDKTMYVKSGVNVRTLPTTDGSEVLKTLSTNDEVHVIGKCNEDNWYKLEDNTFVHGNYLSDEKVTVNTSVANTVDYSSITNMPVDGKWHYNEVTGRHEVWCTYNMPCPTERNYENQYASEHGLQGLTQTIYDDGVGLWALYMW